MFFPGGSRSDKYQLFIQNRHFSRVFKVYHDLIWAIESLRCCIRI